MCSRGIQQAAARPARGARPTPAVSGTPGGARAPDQAPRARQHHRRRRRRRWSPVSPPPPRSSTSPPGPARRRPSPRRRRRRPPRARTSARPTRRSPRAAPGPARSCSTTTSRSASSSTALNAPQATAGLIQDVEDGYYDGKTCHRLATSDGFAFLQCGSLDGTGAGDPAFSYGPVENAPADNIYPAGTHRDGARRRQRVQQRPPVLHRDRRHDARVRLGGRLHDRRPRDQRSREADRRTSPSQGIDDDSVPTA